MMPQVGPVLFGQYSADLHSRHAAMVHTGVYQSRTPTLFASAVSSMELCYARHDQMWQGLTMARITESSLPEFLYQWPDIRQSGLPYSLFRITHHCQTASWTPLFRMIRS